MLIAARAFGKKLAGTPGIVLMLTVAEENGCIGSKDLAALPGVMAAHTELPVIGVPLTSKNSAAGGLDAILSAAQMPPGVPVACVGLNAARNAAVLAARILDA